MPSFYLTPAGTWYSRYQVPYFAERCTPPSSTKTFSYHMYIWHSTPFFGLCRKKDKMLHAKSCMTRFHRLIWHGWILYFAAVRLMFRSILYASLTILSFTLGGICAFFDILQSCECRSNGRLYRVVEQALRRHAWHAPTKMDRTLSLSTIRP